MVICPTWVKGSSPLEPTYRSAGGAESGNVTGYAELLDEGPGALTPQLVFDVVQQVFRIADELALGAKRQAAAKPFRRALVERTRVERLIGRSAPRDLVRRELVAPAECVPEPRIVMTRGDRA